MAPLKVEVRLSKSGASICGFVNNRLYETFPGGSTGKKMAETWVKMMERTDVYPNRVEGTGGPGRWAWCIDDNLQDTAVKKTTLIRRASAWAITEASKSTPPTTKS